MKLTKLFAVALAVSFLPAAASAAVIGFNTVQTPAEAAGPGFIANDLLINFEGNLGGLQMWLQLDGTDETFNSTAAEFGSDLPPNPALFAVNAAVEFDTFVTIGGLTSTDPNLSDVLIIGGAANIPGAPAERSLTGGTLSVTWAPGTGVVIDGGTDFPIARITLPPTINGNALFYLTTIGDDPLLIRRSVIDGVIVPEPASMALASLAALGMVAIRRRS